MKALIVDDSRPIRRIEAGILKDLGFETAEACHGKEALEKLQADPFPELAVVDWNMPEMDGLELVKELRRNQRYSNVVVLMVTSESDAERTQLALSAGANEYLMKPFQKESLVDKLRLVGLV